jgi:hypothetical protein
MLSGFNNRERRMNVGKTLFAQVMEFVPWKTFGRIIERHKTRPPHSAALAACSSLRAAQRPDGYHRGKQAAPEDSSQSVRKLRWRNNQPWIRYVERTSVFRERDLHGVFVLRLALKISNVSSDIVLSGLKLATDSPCMALSDNTISFKDFPICLKYGLCPAFIRRRHNTESEFASQHNCWKTPFRLNGNRINLVLGNEFGCAHCSNGE